MLLTASGAGISQSRTITLTLPPDFSVDVNPTTVLLQAGIDQELQFMVGAFNGYAGTLSVSLGGLPDDVTVVTGPVPADVVFTAGDCCRGGLFLLKYQPLPPVPPSVDLVLTVSDGRITRTHTIGLTLGP
jgi:hypothetical protein